jgi:hypothetical protein
VQDTIEPSVSAPVDARAECTSPDGTPVNLGSPVVGDACDADPSVSNDAPPLFPLGTTTVTWSATDEDGNRGQDAQSVLVEDTTPPVIDCGAPATITPPKAPVSFTATAEDVCVGPLTPEILDYGCYKMTKKGKVISKLQSCVVSFAGDTLTISDSGGVDARIVWTARVADGNGNTSTTSCGVNVVLP